MRSILVATVRIIRLLYTIFFTVVCKSLRPHNEKMPIFYFHPCDCIVTFSVASLAFL